MGACAEKSIAMTFLTMNGRFLASVIGIEKGNVLLRKTQYRISDSEEDSFFIARNILLGKFHNSRWVLERAIRDHALRMDVQQVTNAAKAISNATDSLREKQTLGQLRGIEGEVASRYFSVFNELILQNKEAFIFDGRNRRPPLDRVNALLSFSYALLSNDVSAALNATGIDPFIGFLHRDRPGRRSLALDLMEELRAPIADRFVLTLINNRQLDSNDFVIMENGAVFMKDEARKVILTSWQKRKQDQITHPFLKEKIPWGLVPHVQALLLARHLRGDLDEYPPFLWK
jgi:CRISPR-associated protein Cas1